MDPTAGPADRPTHGKGPPVTVKPPASWRTELYRRYSIQLSSIIEGRPATNGHPVTKRQQPTDIRQPTDNEVNEMLHQKTEWGHISWIHMQDEDSTKESFSVGVTHLLPGKRLQSHVHYGIDQFIYVLDGEGIYVINGEEKKFHKGMYFYIEAESSHETINTGNVPVREFLVASPVGYQEKVPLNEDLLEELFHEEMNDSHLIYSAVEAIRSQLLKSVSLPFTIFDNVWSVVIQNNNFSNYCTDLCDPVRQGSAPCMLERGYDHMHNDQGGEFICEHGLSVFHYPIVFNGRQLGAIRGGHILISERTARPYAGVYDFPESSVIGINNLLKQIASSISSYCSFHASRLLLEKKESDLKDVLISNNTLKKDLFSVNDKVTNLRINHHFLFNTLNSMASMALTGDRYDLYNAIIDLSKMFRYTMTVDLKFVSLGQEIENLETYLNFQRMRYGSGLEVNYDIDERLYEAVVPFNFLQPIVENAFTHGFSTCDEKKKLAIQAEVQGGSQGDKGGSVMTISVINNGEPLTEVTRNRINRSLSSNSGHGLSLIHVKLTSAYGANFRMEVASNARAETCVELELPLEYKEVSHDQRHHRR